MTGTSFGSQLVAPWVLFAQMSWGWDAVPVITAAQPQEAGTVAEVRDRGGVFSRGAERRARDALRSVHHRHRAPVLVETVRSLDGAWAADVARRRAETAGADRLYVLVAGEERDVGVVGARRGPASRLTDRQRETIRRAFLGPLRAGKADEAIDQGVRAIGTALDAATARPRLGARDAMISGAALAASLAAVVVSQVWGRSRRRGRRRCRSAACARADGPVSAGAVTETLPSISAGARAPHRLPVEASACVGTPLSPACGRGRTEA